MRVSGLLVIFILFALEVYAYPHLGVRHIWDEVPILDSSGQPTGQSLSPGDVVVPCVLRNSEGEGLTVGEGEILMGFKKVFSEPEVPNFNQDNLQSIISAYQNVQKEHQNQYQSVTEAQKQYNQRDDFESMACPEDIDGVVPLLKLSPNPQTTRFAPAPSTNMNLAESLEQIGEQFNTKGTRCLCSNSSTSGSEIFQLIHEFHNTNDCLAAELDVNARIDAYKRAWTQFIEEKKAQGEDPNLLEKAKHTDFAARTAVWEGDINQGCNGKGTCERDIILLSLRNRGEACPNATYGCEEKGDISSLATKESQYNIWSNISAKKTYITSCLLRNDRQDDVPDSMQAEWTSPEQEQSYQQVVRIYKQAVERAELILFASDEELIDKENNSGLFNAGSSEVVTQLRHYYHPPAMRQCFPQFPNRSWVTEAYVKCGEELFVLRYDTVMLGNSQANDRQEFTVLSIDDKGNIDPADDDVALKDRYPGCTIDPARSRQIQKERDRCAPFGLPALIGEEFNARCSESNQVYHRTYPSWAQPKDYKEIQCRQVPSQGQSCSAEESRVDIEMGGPCDRKIAPITGVY